MFARRNTSKPSRARTGVSALALWCLVASLALLSGHALAGPCELKRLAAVDLTMRDGVPTVPVIINGHPAAMSVNTTNAVGEIRFTSLNSFGLDRQDLPGSLYVMRGHYTITQNTTTDSFAIGLMKIGGLMRYRSPKFLVLPDRGKLQDGVPVGELGMDVLGASDFELDFAHNKLNFYSQDHCPGEVVYWTDHYSSAPITRGHGGNYYFPMEIDGKKVMASLSTSDTKTWFATDATRKLFGFDEKSAGTQTETGNSGPSRFRAMSLTGEGFAVRNAEIQLYSQRLPPDCRLVIHGPDDAVYRSNCEGGEAPLIMGMDIARHLHFYFATKERVLYVSEADPTK